MFETPGTSLQTSSSDQFEVALINEPELQRFAEGSPDTYAFDEHFNKCLESAINNKYSKVIFIHGIGNGTLKNSIANLKIE